MFSNSKEIIPSRDGDDCHNHSCPYKLAVSTVFKLYYFTYLKKASSEGLISADLIALASAWRMMIF